MTTTTTRRNLVIVRAGEKSLHRQWLADAEERNWDLIVSWYGDADYVPVADERVLVRKGGFWDAVYAHFTAMPELLERYEHIWLPDDDILTDAGSINTLFDIVQAEKLAVAQPGLTADSYFSWVHTLVSPSFRLRYTTIVEVMAPCLEVGLIKRMMPHFPGTPSGYGLDWVWARLEDDNRRRGAIIDAVPMRHTRLVGQFLASRLKQRGIDPLADGELLGARFGYEGRREFPCYGGITATGRAVGQWATAWLMFRDYMGMRPALVEPSATKRLKRMFRFFYRRPDLSKLSEGPGVGRDEARATAR